MAILAVVLLVFSLGCTSAPADDSNANTGGVVVSESDTAEIDAVIDDLDSEISEIDELLDESDVIIEDPVIDETLI